MTLRHGDCPRLQVLEGRVGPFIKGGRQMTILLIVITAIGATLGARFKVFALVPAMLFIITAMIANGMANGYDVHFTLFRMLCCSAALQIGYFTFCVIRARWPMQTTVHYRRPNWNADPVLKTAPPSNNNGLRDW